MARSIYVPQAGGFIDFKDDATDAQIVSYLQAKYPPATEVAPEAPAPGPDDSGIAGRFAYGLATGLTDIPGGIAALMYPAEEASQSAGGKFSEGAREYLQGTLGIDPTKEATTAQTLAQGVGFLGSFLIPGLGAGKAVGLLGAGIKGASRAGAVAASAQGAAVNAEARAERIRNQLESGMDITEDQQLASQRLSGLVGLSEGLPLGRVFGPLQTVLSKVPVSKAPIVERIIQSRLSKIATTGGAEGLQEAASGIADDLVEYGVYNPNVEIGQDILSNAGTGAFSGSLLEGIIQIAAGRKLGAARQLQADLARERGSNGALLRQSEITSAAENLRQYNVTGPVTISEEEIEGGTSYTIRSQSGKAFGVFYAPEDAKQAVEIYKQRTGANVAITEPPKAPSVFPVKIGTKKFNSIDEIMAAREAVVAKRDEAARFISDPEFLKSAAAAQKVSETYYKVVAQKEVERQDAVLKKIDSFLAAAEGRATPEAETAPEIAEATADENPELTDQDFEPETIPEEMPIGAVEMPVEEQRYIEEAVPTEQVVAPEEAPRMELRTSATDEQLTDLKAELFGTPKNVRDMTPEERATYEAERDKRYPPVETPVYYDVAQTGVPRTISEVEARPDPRAYTPEYQTFLNDVATGLKNRLGSIGLGDVNLELNTALSDQPGYLIKGEADGMKNLIRLATGYVRPGLTVEQMVNELVGTLNHEAIHVFRGRGVIRPAEWRILSRAVENTKVPGKKYTYLDKAQSIYGEMGGVYTDPETVIEEAVAEMYRDYATAKNIKGTPQAARGLFNRITEFIRRLFRTLQNNKYQDVFKRIESGQMQGREAAPGGVGARFSATPAYNPKTSNSDWETSGAPPKGVSSVNKTGGSPFRISQRRPTTVNEVGQSLTDNLLINVAAMKQNMPQYVHNVGILKSYPIMQPVKGEDADATLKRFKKIVVQNLLWLHDQMKPEIRARAKKWYDGARNVATGLAKHYNIPDTSAAAVIAALSPQMDWFKNVSLAERLIDIMATKQNAVFDEKMLADAMSRPTMAAYKPIFRMIAGRKLKDMKNFTEADYRAARGNSRASKAMAAKDIQTANKLAEAMFIRFYDEVYNPRSYHILTPEGGKGPLSTNNDGSPSMVGWGSFDMISKGISAFRNPNKQNIDEVLGDQHKIRNFYNNILSPMSKDGSVTIDTHAVAAAHIRPLSGSSDEVHHNFGTSTKDVLLKTANSGTTGVQGLYAIYADAYREAAAMRGILPREMQSITWEAVRGLYKATFKAQAKNTAAIDAIWEQYKKGKISANEARKRILAFADAGAKGINTPFWVGEPDTLVYAVDGPSANRRAVRPDGVREASGATGRGGSGTNTGGAKGGVRFSAAPALNSDEFRKWFRQSKVVNPDGTPKVYYHGTPFSFAQFGKGRSASLNGEEGPFFFSPSTKFANQYAENKLHAGGYGKKVTSGGRMIPVYISAQKPFDYDNIDDVKALIRALRDGYASGAYTFGDLMEFEGDELASFEKLIASGVMNSKEELVIDRLDTLFRKLYKSGLWAELEGKGVQKAIRDMGYDGFYVKEGGFKNLAVYSPVQVKSIFNQFEEGTATSPRFSAVPLPPSIEIANDTLFAPAPKEGFFNWISDFFLGPPTTLNTVNGPVEISKSKMQRLKIRAGAVDDAAFVTELEKIANQSATGNYERMMADYSATVALAMRKRSSQVNASMLMRGKLTLDYARPGDIQSATMKVEDDPDSMANIIKILLEPGPPDGRTGEPDDKRKLFKSYASAMRARNLKAKGVVVPNELSDSYINTVIPFTQQNYPEVVQAYEMYQRFNRNLLKTARDSGLIDDTAYQKLVQNMDYYGFYREVFENVAAPGSATKTASKFELRAMKGGQHGNMVNDPVYVMVHNAQFWVDSIAKNIAAQKAFKLARDMGVARILGSTEKPDQSLGEEEQVMFFRENGVQKRFAVSDPLLVTALGADDRTDVGRFFQLMGMPTALLRETVTRDPGFMIANLARDTLSAWITSGSDITPFIDTVRGFAKAYNGTASYQALMGRGIVGSYDLAMKGPKEVAEELRSRATPRNVLTLNGPAAATAVAKGLWNRLGALSEYSDAATRIAVYEAAKAKGLSDAEAAFQAIEILDFSRRGGSQAISILTKLIPFLNARIQGLDVLYQAGKAGVKYATGRAEGERERNLGKKFLVRGGMLMAVSLALEMMNSDDEDYQQLDDYIKNSNLLIPLSTFGLKGQFLAIPKPFEAGLLFSTLPQQFYKTMSGDASTRENLNLFTSSLASTFMVNPIPQAILPIVEIITNHDFYTGLPLISEGKARLAPELQYNSRTSQLAMMLGNVPIWYDLNSGRFEGMSPIIIDNLIGGYGGPLGTYFADAVGMAMEGFEMGPERLPRDLSQLPVVRRFFMDAESKNPKVVTQAYELFRQVDEANRSFSRLRQAGDTEAVMDYLDKNRDVLSYKRYVFKLVDGLNKLSARERAIERDTTMTDAEKKEAMLKLREMRIRIASKVGEINEKLGR